MSLDPMIFSINQNAASIFNVFSTLFCVAIACIVNLNQ